ncbi:hypothetical protein WA158_002536 [Blastocystis sp. Blastoise]
MNLNNKDIIYALAFASIQLNNSVPMPIGNGSQISQVSLEDTDIASVIDKLCNLFHKIFLQCYRNEIDKNTLRLHSGRILSYIYKSLSYASMLQIQNDANQSTLYCQCDQCFEIFKSFIEQVCGIIIRPELIVMFCSIENDSEKQMIQKHEIQSNFSKLLIFLCENDIQECSKSFISPITNIPISFVIILIEIETIQECLHTFLSRNSQDQSLLNEGMNLILSTLQQNIRSIMITSNRTRINQLDSLQIISKLNNLSRRFSNEYHLPYFSTKIQLILETIEKTRQDADELNYETSLTES